MNYYIRVNIAKDKMSASIIKRHSTAVTESREIIIGGVKCAVDGNGTVDLPLARIPHVSLSELPHGIKFSVSNDLSTIIVDAGAKQNVRVLGKTSMDLDTSEHRLLSRIYYETIARAYKRNQTIEVKNDLSGQNNMFPAITATIEAMTLRELVNGAIELAMELLFSVTEIARNMSRLRADAGEQTEQMNFAA